MVNPTVPRTLFALLTLTMATPPTQDTIPSSLEAPPHPTREFKGNTDLKHCDDSFPNDLFWIDKITVQPEKLYIETVFLVRIDGYFTAPILPESTWTQTVNFINSTESETWTQPFCRMIDHIDQEPNAVVSPLEVERREASVIREERGEVRGSGSGEVKKRANDKGCPPKKGWATVWMEGYVWSMFVVPGDYHFKWEAKNADGRRIYCVETDIRFDYEGKVASQK